MSRGRAIRRRLPGRRDESGTSAVEYGLLVAAITAVIAAVVFSIGIQVRARFDDTCRAIANGSNRPAVSAPAARAVQRSPATVVSDSGC